MVDADEMRQLMADLKKSLSEEILDFRMEFRSFRNETERDIKQIMQQNAALRQDVEALMKRTDELETRVSGEEDEMSKYQEEIKRMQTRIHEMGEQVDYIENKSRQNNVCIYNIDENSEGEDAIAFVQKLCKDLLRIEREIPVARAHRIGQRKENSLRPIIVNFTNYKEKKEVLKAAWSRKEILFNDKRIYLDHDYTTKVKQQRTQYRTVREQLKKLQIKSHILSPAKLKIFNQDGTTTVYKNAEQAQKDLQQRGLYKP